MKFLIALVVTFLLLVGFLYRFDWNRNHEITQIARENAVHSLESIANTKLFGAMVEVRSFYSFESIFQDYFRSSDWTFAVGLFTESLELRSLYSKRDTFNFSNATELSQQKWVDSVCRTFADGYKGCIFHDNTRDGFSWLDFLFKRSFYLFLLLLFSIVVVIFFRDLAFYQAANFRLVSGLAALNLPKIVNQSLFFRKSFDKLIAAVASAEKVRTENEENKLRYEGVVLSAQQTAHDILTQWVCYESIVKDALDVISKNPEHFINVDESKKLLARSTDLDVYHAQMQDVVSDLMNINKHESIHQEAVDIGEIVSRVARSISLRSTLPEKFELNLQHTGLAFVDSSISRVFFNLQKNAYDAAGYRGRVWINTSDSSDGKIRVVIGNDGTDVIDERVILKPFSTTKANGHGLGLTIVRKILMAHGEDFRFYLKEGGKAIEFEFFLQRLVHA